MLQLTASAGILSGPLSRETEDDQPQGTKKLATPPPEPGETVCWLPANWLLDGWV
jgi:hypothetical protein